MKVPGETVTTAPKGLNNSQAKEPVLDNTLKSHEHGTEEAILP